MIDIRGELIRQEKLFWEANLARDVEYFQDNLDEEALAISSWGVIDKAGALEQIASAPTEYTSYEMNEPRVIFLGDDSAAVTYEADIVAQAGDKEMKLALFATTVYVKRGGSWRAILHQQTPRQDS